MQRTETLAEPTKGRASARCGYGNTLRNPRLARGDVVVLTGVMSEHIDRLVDRLVKAEFVVEPLVTKRTAVLVAADLGSLSSKARSYGIPIVEESFVKAPAQEP